MRHSYSVAAHFAGEWDESRVRRWAESVRTRLDAPSVTLGIVFMTPGFFDVAAEVLDLVRLHARVPTLVGCSSQSLIANGEEFEDQPGLVLQLFHLPGAELRAVHFGQEAMESCETESDWHRMTGVPTGRSRGWLVFADPFNLDGERWLRAWNAAYPGVPSVGGLASGIFEHQITQLYLDGAVYEEGIVALSVSGGVRMETVVSQGCSPIGCPWTITRADRNLIFTVGNRPAYEVLLETVNGLSKEDQGRVQGNLFVGFASNEYQEEFQRGDFLVRNLIGANPENGMLAVGAVPRTGQTMQFHRRDSDSASQDLVASLALARERLRDTTVMGGVLGVCNGRGSGLFGRPHHDAGLVQEQLGPLSVAGFFCNGELGPVGSRNFLHGYTASLGLFVKA